MSTLPFVSPGGFVCVCFFWEDDRIPTPKTAIGVSLSLSIYKKIKPNEPPPPKNHTPIKTKDENTIHFALYSYILYTPGWYISVQGQPKKKREAYFFLFAFSIVLFLFFVFGLCIGCISYSLPLTTLLTREKRLCDNNNKSIIIIPLLSRERLIKSRKSTSKKREAKVVSSTTTHVVVVVFALHIGVS